MTGYSDWYDLGMKWWKGGNSVNGRSSWVRLAKGHPRSRGQLVSRVKGFQDREQVDVGTGSARTGVLFAG